MAARINRCEADHDNGEWGDLAGKDRHQMHTKSKENTQLRGSLSLAPPGARKRTCVTIFPKKDSRNNY